MTARDAECHNAQDAALYVLGELQGHQLEAFTRHLRSCEQCAEEVDLLDSAADAVPLLASRHISVEVIEEQQKEPERRAPVLTAAMATTQASVAREQLRAENRRPMLRAILGGAAATQPPAPPGSGGRLRVLRTPMPKPAALGILCLGLIAAVTIALSHEAATIRYVRIKAGWSDGGAALKFQGNRVELLVIGMPQPVTGHAYQVWVLDRSSKRLVPTSAWVSLNGKGEADIKVPGDYHAWEALAVYVEPLSGPHNTKSGAVVVGDLRNQR
jgi:hypothetical protein